VEHAVDIAKVTKKVDRQQSDVVAKQGRKRSLEEGEADGDDKKPSKKSRRSVAKL